VLLFGGGFALASGFQSTGLSQLIGGRLAGLAGIPPLLLVVMLCFIIVFLTELTSNTATTEMILPVLAAVAVATNVHPLMLMIPATIAASCGFMLPAGTPPNAIVFGSGKVTIGEMARAGFAVNVAAVLVVSVLFYFLGMAVFGIEPGVMPDWATLRP
jgi:sodium-dependent dicarboxylate transporter 2/3/5